MTTTTDEHAASLPMVLDEVEVHSASRVSPSYVRVELAGPALADCGTDGPLLDQRMKIVFPSSTGALPDLSGADASWWDTWLAIPEDQRGSIRTYTIRDLVRSGAGTRIVVDIVVHDPREHTGPGNEWALRAAPGDRIVVAAPRRGHAFGGIEWSPGDASRLLLAGDETALPAVRGILRDLPADAVGAAFVEVPAAGDIQRDVLAPTGVEVTWLPRGDAPRGASLHAAVVAWLTGSAEQAPAVDDAEIDPDLWETPVHSSSGEQVAPYTQVPTGDSPYAGLYAWIAGESKVVTGLRRRLVSDLGVDRAQVAFMGYWREGVAMRS
ncbi:siderophore-interacting protein [Nocardioides sp. MH1]|uniref:siderophore-interacting protein n=1 Tax=Nocardioides sp. MH1 TaxID=3242490 RepID=UPI00352205AD